MILAYLSLSFISNLFSNIWRNSLENYTHYAFFNLRPYIPWGMKFFNNNIVSQLGKHVEACTTLDTPNNQTISFSGHANYTDTYMIEAILLFAILHHCFHTTYLRIYFYVREGVRAHVRRLVDYLLNRHDLVTSPLRDRTFVDGWTYFVWSWCRKPLEVLSNLESWAYKFGECTFSISYRNGEIPYR